MAPVGMIGTVGWFSSAEVGIISLVAFLVLSATLLVLCARCFRKPTNAYDVNGTMKVRSGGGAKGTSGANGVASPNLGGNTNPDYSWRDHKSMPVNTLSNQK